MIRPGDLTLLAAALIAVPGQAQTAAAPVEMRAPGAPATDPELLRPLTPLADFTVEPVAPPTASDGKPVVIHYDVSVAGIAATGVGDQFDALSTLRENGRKSESMAQVAIRADEDVKLLEKLLRADGYFDAQADSAITPVPGDAARLKVVLTATPGERYRLTTITLTGPATVPPLLARSAFKLQPGAPIVAIDIESAEANIKLRLPEQGYPFVTLGQRDIVLDDVTHGGDYTLPVAPGVRSRFAGIRLEGDPVLPPAHVAVIARFKPGELYDNRKVDDLRRALVATSLYSSVSIEPVPPADSAVDSDGTAPVDLLVKGGRGPRRTLSGSAGYATGEGVKLQGSYINRNRFPPEGALEYDVIAGNQLQSLGASFRRSNAGQRDRSFQASLTAANQDFAAYNAKTVTLAASLARLSTPIWQKRWTWSAGLELTASREHDFDESRSTSDARLYGIVAVPLQLGFDSSDNLLDPTRGFRVTIRNSPELSYQSTVFGYDRSQIEGTAYRRVGKNIVLAARLRTAEIVGASTAEIAPTRRIYAGGGGSVRGFGYQELGPKDATNAPIGGRSSVEFGTEVRYRFGNFGVVPFLDGGQVYDASLPKLTGLRYGAGIGGRYYTNFGPLRFDVATPLGRKPGESPVSVYISIGQAF
ncbi:autotransporter assembly complex protein TamA [Glacieibacterium megasporae]|uniref:autotransporter assembly complex protein TamA n=1 Tax=Glacieibacterium megasporae TaxID=2835787 RepID=UPI001C1DD20C|nr:BamA/TamA family outer membrane protein [Polymorphobacter megasporae]UAJ09377.1 BamA/TamA family outer membrane protein [Polymorphobacter megasporae]